jgi:D-alanyl-D-alanine carboxypeptidase
LIIRRFQKLQLLEPSVKNILIKTISIILIITTLTALAGCISPFAVGNSTGSPTYEIPAGVPPVETEYDYYSRANTAEGVLVLVNKAYAFDPDKVGELVSLTINANYQLRDNLQKLTPVALNALNKMTEDFVAAAGGNAQNAIITASYRTKEKQQQLVDANPSQEGTLIQSPLHSEHHTGLAIDMQAYVNGLMYGLDWFDEYDWLYENMYKYGYVVRYTTEKSGITGINNEPWHLRYVGIPHAEYMYKNNLCLEEYIELISNYTVESPLKMSGGAPTYYVYHVKASSADAVTSIPVYKGYDYEISGNNTDGYIVTCWKAE